MADDLLKLLQENFVFTELFILDIKAIINYIFKDLKTYWCEYHQEYIIVAIHLLELLIKLEETKISKTNLRICIEEYENMKNIDLKNKFTRWNKYRFRESDTDVISDTEIEDSELVKNESDNVYYYEQDYYKDLLQKYGPILYVVPDKKVEHLPLIYKILRVIGNYYD